MLIRYKTTTSRRPLTNSTSSAAIAKHNQSRQGSLARPSPSSFSLYFQRAFDKTYARINPQWTTPVSNFYRPTPDYAIPFSIQQRRNYADDSKKSVVDLIKSDHAEVDKLFKTIQDKSQSLSTRQESLNKMVISLSEHSAAEEMLVYPAIRKAAKDDALADKSLSEHQTVKELLEAIRKMSPDHEKFPNLLKELQTNVQEHVKMEESTLLPELQSSVSSENLISMGTYFTMAKKMAPPTPHPGAPNTPPGNMVAGPIATFLDKLKQVVKGEPSSAQA